MKHFLPLIILTGLLFGQDVLHLKSGESFEGIFYGKLGSDLLFKAAGDINTKKFPINDVEIIETNNGELSYPFEIPKVTSYDYKITIEYQALSFEEKAKYDARETYKIFLNTDVVNYPDGLNNEEKTLYRKYYDIPKNLHTSDSVCKYCHYEVLNDAHFCKMCGAFPI